MSIEDERAAVTEINFRGFPCRVGGLVSEARHLCRGFVFVSGDPSADCLP